MTSSKTTTDHEIIRQWAEQRGGRPSAVSGTGGRKDAGILQIDFPDRNEPDNLEEITWEEFFDKFEESSLAFLYQEETADGKISRFSKFVSRRSDR
ncbi:MAG TPA: hypothetical protein VKZ87_13570, partial [Ferrovibrio sp.]|uniref:hypothetical protein n=1 Tax=Ferrovibrio sp. TaxID=1917215 RepID=UPI002B4B48CE